MVHFVVRRDRIFWYSEIKEKEEEGGEHYFETFTTEWKLEIYVIAYDVANKKRIFFQLYEQRCIINHLLFQKLREGKKP